MGPDVLSESHTFAVVFVCGDIKSEDVIRETVSVSGTRWPADCVLSCVCACSITLALSAGSSGALGALCTNDELGLVELPMPSLYEYVTGKWPTPNENIGFGGVTILSRRLADFL